nr:50S ribosomal protein L4 [Patescibacteria group bacterium]
LWAFSGENKDGMRASRNIKNVRNVFIDSLNILDMLNNKFLLLDKNSIKNIEGRYEKVEEEKESPIETKKEDKK